MGTPRKLAYGKNGCVNGDFSLIDVVTDHRQPLVGVVIDNYLVSIIVPSTPHQKQ